MAGNAPRQEEDAHAPAKERRGLRKGLYLLPSAFTAANISMGFYAVMGALRGFQLLDEDSARAVVHFNNSAVAIAWAILFDTLDGRIARLTKTTTEIGVQLDSIADVVTFGIAPAVLAYAWGYGATFAEGSAQHKLGWFVSFMFLICGAFRLARFNVQSTRPRPLSEGTVKVDKKSFIGLPIPAAAGLIAAIIHFMPEPLMRSWYGEWAIVYSGLLMGLIATLSALMVSTVRYSSFKTVGTGRRSTRVAILFVAAVGMLLWLFSGPVLLIILSAYVLHGIVLRTLSLFRRRPATESNP